MNKLRHTAYASGKPTAILCLISGVSDCLELIFRTIFKQIVFKVHLGIK